MKKFILLIASIIFSQALHAADDIKSVVLKEEKKQFVTVMDPIQFADVYGDASTKSYGRFGKFPANFETPMHVHSHGYRAIVVKGLMTNPFGDEKNAPVMKPGSFWSVKAGDNHKTACVSDVSCEFFVYSEHSFDFKVVDEK
ncbi:DUF4437 domain-containing protein [Moritella viscosa]|uniref:DUF4437 domain-containing protein n=1 Tax=Moritella viscosa TaxID=80854 RepID=A0A1L0C8F6_9GAMM|nr:DUF4437 domain-containing protein [Moritella viscosa]SGZ07370.1 Putative uncharacterized protein [Moritella viscosa]SGZ16666.1 Putative uncharacterized protein [Moritella viscosa]SHO15714.1 Putative uncharacterized protein [Moritella viscosa]SHO15789.1 Putative uncharacterized protein [Moritella viscosa]SHO17635.1 Putative uncharacterized protein [Moritella viscosa]